MKKQGNKALSKEQNKSPKTDPKEMEIYDLLIKEFKIIISKDSMRCKRTQIDN